MNFNWTYHLLACFLMLKIISDSLAETTTTSGFYLTSGPDYDNLFPYTAKYSMKIRTVNLTSGTNKNSEAALECGRLCIQTETCSSFVLHPAFLNCTLSSLDRCSLEKDVMSKASGHKYYEIVPGEKTNPTENCYSKCLKEKGNCELCGRPGCYGDLCRHCPKNCWNLNPKVNGMTQLWTYGVSPKWQKCDGDWELFWDGGSQKNTNNVHNLALQIRLNYEDGTKILSNFDYFKMKYNKISVGSFLDGQGNNSWGAPFQNRPFRKFFNSTCFNFYYPEEIESCQANGVEDILDDDEMEFSKKGYFWMTGDNTLDNMVIKKIEMWMTPMD